MFILQDGKGEDPTKDITSTTIISANLLQARNWMIQYIKPTVSVRRLLLPI